MTTGDSMGPFPDDPGIVDAFGRVARDIGILIGAASALASGNLEIARQSSMAKERPTLLALGDLQDASRRGLVSESQYINTLSRMGYSATAQGVIAALSEQLLGLSENAELRKRGTISEEEYVKAARDLGYSEQSAREFYSLTEYVPTAPDVVQFAVREVYTPEIAERYGQFQDFPDAAMEDFARAGLSREQALKYWAAHWGLPSLEQAIEMYHRRAETGFTLDDVMTLMRAQDVMPFYREKLLAIASAPYTRVDVRRMHKLGILTLDQVAEAYQALGYSDERARNLALFTEKVNAQESDDALEPWRAGLRGRVTSMYQARNLPRHDAEQMLADLGYKPEAIAAFITEADFIREASIYDDWRASIKRLYVAGHWTREQAIRKLLDLGFAEGEIVDLIPLWDVDRELREQTAEERHEKDLTKAEVIGAYTDALMVESDAREALESLGYDRQEVDVLLGRADIAKAKAARTEAESTLHTLYVAGRKGAGEVRSTLGALGLASARVDALLVKWDAELDAKSPELTVAQISAALKKGIIEEGDAGRRLEHLGYAEEERAIIIALAMDGLA